MERAARAAHIVQSMSMKNMKSEIARKIPNKTALLLSAAALPIPLRFKPPLFLFFVRHTSCSVSSQTCFLAR